MMSRRMLVFLVVMASLVATGRPALLSPEGVLPQPIATRPWTERLNVGRTQSRIGVLQRMTLNVPRALTTRSARPIVLTLALAPINPLRYALPPPAIDRA